MQSIAYAACACSARRAAGLPPLAVQRRSVVVRVQRICSFASGHACLSPESAIETMVAFSRRHSSVSDARVYAAVKHANRSKWGLQLGEREAGAGADAAGGGWRARWWLQR